MKKCSFCAEAIQDDAIKCRYCGEMIRNAEEVTSEARITPHTNKSASSIGIIGFVMFVAGLMTALYYYRMDVTVETMGGRYVNNIGLMSDRSTGLAIGGVVLALGFISVVAAQLKRA